jgi:dTDP-4-dehydrorhamnose reductase
MRAVVLGAAGQLGRDLCKLLRSRHDVREATRAQVELTHHEAVHGFLHELRPDAVINCTAYNFVDRAESESDAAFAVNTWAVRNLARVCADLDCLLVHFSTDHVFGLDASRNTPWREGDAPGPVNVYGLSKLAGEYLIRALCHKHLVLRTCGLYGVWGSGGKGGNFVETMLRLGREKPELKVVADQFCTPSYTIDVAAATVALLEHGARGLFHLTSEGHCSWHEFARTIFQLQKMAVDVKPITSAQFGAAARRPAYSVLDTGAYRALGLPPLRPWREALAAYLEERETRA